MNTERRLAAMLLTAIVLALAAPAAADTVYMKNGRAIRSAWVRVEGDRVHVRLFRGEVVFPMSLVDRIVEDDAVEPAPTQPPAPEPDAGPDDPGPTTGAPATDAGAEPAAGDPPAADPAAQPAAAPEPPPHETREYWQNRLLPLNTELERLDRELDSLRSRNGAAVAAQIQRLETRRAGVQEQVDAIRLEARRLGVPPGWLR